MGRLVLVAHHVRVDRDQLVQQLDGLGHPRLDAARQQGGDSGVAVQSRLDQTQHAVHASQQLVGHGSHLFRVHLRRLFAIARRHGCAKRCDPGRELLPQGTHFLPQPPQLRVVARHRQRTLAKNRRIRVWAFPEPLSGNERREEVHLQ